MLKKDLTFVYICRSGENEELRYSIRSVLHHYPDAKIWVVGDPPKWYDGDYIKVKQDSTKYNNAYKNLEEITLSRDIPNNFILMNDDFYVVRHIDRIGYFHEGPLIDKYNMYFDAYQQSSYTKKIIDTNAKLVKLGHATPISYELHVPFPVEKWKLARAIRHDRLLWRSMYGNIFEVGGEQMEDVKVYSTTRMNFKNYDYTSECSPFLSTDDKSFPLILKEVLEKRFPAKSSLEK